MFFVSYYRAGTTIIIISVINFSCLWSSDCCLETVTASTKTQYTRTPSQLVFLSLNLSDLNFTRIKANVKGFIF